MAALMAIYAKEDPKHGAFFDPGEYANHQSPKTDEDRPTLKGSTLRVLD